MKTFWFLESIGGLSWVYMYLVWIIDFEFLKILIVPLALSAVLFSFWALVYAVARLDRKSTPFIAILAGNFWVVADSLWAVNDSYGVEALLQIARLFTFLLMIVATWEFFASKDNVEKLAHFAEFFRKFKNG
ncbi:MAG: hypothetical protein HYT67_00355 [Candidatus Yanofskybacteria bacterium]|nr:hypothetical protein [Candidatus Yanofskybacteria bacterium]